MFDFIFLAIIIVYLRRITQRLNVLIKQGEDQHV
ncbi:MAG: hypothetical protein JWM11_6511 [Planctomycetaceae bacterium]|nr:hypothetical protein [Planctomycetaceae bacterium]